GAYSAAGSPGRHRSGPCRRNAAKPSTCSIVERSSGSGGHADQVRRHRRCPLSHPPSIPSAASARRGSGRRNRRRFSLPILSLRLRWACQDRDKSRRLSPLLIRSQIMFPIRGNSCFLSLPVIVVLLSQVLRKCTAFPYYLNQDR